MRYLFLAAMLMFGLAPAARAEMVTVNTAAGVPIRVASDFAGPISGFIAALAARGIRPTQIHCLSFARSHVRHSLHHQGRACDFNGSANRFRPMNHHRVAALARAYGLRDGCDFGDCGHIDMGPTFALSAHRHHRAVNYARKWRRHHYRLARR